MIWKFLCPQQKKEFYFSSNQKSHWNYHENDLYYNLLISY